MVLSLFVASMLGDLSIFPALAAISVMSRTFEEGLMECRNQAIGILIGGLFGFLIGEFYPEPPIWLIGLGVMAIIVLCASFRIGFSCSLSCAIYIVACMTPQTQIVDNILVRLIHTAIGLGVGLAINYLIVPYNNSRQIYRLFRELTDLIPFYLEQRLFQKTVPDLAPIQLILDRLRYEMTVYRHQRYVHRNQKQVYSHMTVCLQLAEHIFQQLQILCAMHLIGVPEPQQLIALSDLGISVPETLTTGKGSQEACIVTNYHLQALLISRSKLANMLKDAPT